MIFCPPIFHVCLYLYFPSSLWSGVKQLSIFLSPLPYVCLRFSPPPCLCFASVLVFPDFKKKKKKKINFTKSFCFCFVIAVCHFFSCLSSFMVMSSCLFFSFLAQTISVFCSLRFWTKKCFCCFKFLIFFLSIFSGCFFLFLQTYYCSVLSPCLSLNSFLWHWWPRSNWSVFFPYLCKV